MPRKDLEARKAYNRERYQLQRAERLADQKTRDDARRPQVQETVRRAHRRRRGIIDATGETKAGPCELCQTHTDPLHLDHWHDGPRKGQIRGWLCPRCNTALGSLRDDPDLLRRAITYLETR